MLSEKRKGRITGSIIGTILGVCPYKTQSEAMRDMVRNAKGAESEFQGNAATEWGTFHESQALADMRDFHDIQGTENTGFFIHPEINWLGCTPDGFTTDDAVIEIKCPYSKRNDKNPDFKTLKEQPHYYAQVQYEMFCSGKQKAFFYQWSPADDLVEEVAFDKSFIDETLPKLEAFYKSFLSEMNNDKHLEPLVIELPACDTAREYAHAKQLFDDAKAALEKAKAALIKKADGKKSQIGDFLVYPVKRQGSIKYASIVKEHCPDIDVEDYRGESKEFWTIK